MAEDVGEDDDENDDDAGDDYADDVETITTVISIWPLEIDWHWQDQVYYAMYVRMRVCVHVFYVCDVDYACMYLRIEFNIQVCL